MCAAQVGLLEKPIDNRGVMWVGAMLCASTQQRSKRLPTWQHNYCEGVRNKQKQIAGWQE